MNDPINWGVLFGWAVPIVVAIIGALGVWISHKVQQGSPEHKMIGLLQEQLDKSDERSDKQDARMEKIEGEIRKFKRREQIRDDYIVRLREHINSGSPPPPPPWPEGLYD